MGNFPVCVFLLDFLFKKPRRVFFTCFFFSTPNFRYGTSQSASVLCFLLTFLFKNPRRVFFRLFFPPYTHFPLWSLSMRIAYI